MKRISWVAVLAVAAVVLAGCGPKGSPTAPPATTSTPEATTTSGPATPGASASPATSPETTAEALPDGRSPVLIKSVDVSGYTITVDLIEFYAGADAETQWRLDHPTATEVPPLNGHYIRNNNPQLRTLPVSTTVAINVIPSGDPDGTDPLAFKDLPTYPQLNAPFWITVDEGVIVLIEQQFIS